MVVVAAGQGAAAGDGQGGRVDDGELVAGLDVGEHLPGAVVAARVIGDIAGFVAQGDGAADRAGGGVDDGFGASPYC